MIIMFLMLYLSIISSNFAYGIYAISEVMSKIIVQNIPITLLSLEEQDHISLTDMATAKEDDNRSAFSNNYYRLIFNEADKP